VVLVDDSQEFRSLLSSILHAKPEFRVVAQASNGHEAVQKIEALAPDLVLLDLGLPELNGLEVARIMRDKSASRKILIVSQESSPEVVDEALRLGACGYVLKSDVENELLRAVSAVLQGKTFLSKTLGR